MKKTRHQTELEKLEKEFRDYFENQDHSREQSLRLAREVIRLSSRAIKKMHQGDFEDSRKLLEQATSLLISARQSVIKFPEIQYAGFLHNAEKELIEALVLYRILKEKTIFIPDFKAFDRISFLHGLSEAMGELRRNILDRMRKNETGELEDMLNLMDDIYYFLNSFDYPDVLTRGLRRSVDVFRSVVEKTRADVTLILQQKSLEKKLQKNGL
ncbi:MAG: haloacid dehalogenase [Candidatus Omnitrophica bacterium]|nr:haloacid dehalogenase [Candidatus Omnitrophota bacterium]